MLLLNAKGHIILILIASNKVKLYFKKMQSSLFWTFLELDGCNWNEASPWPLSSTILTLFI